MKRISTRSTTAIKTDHRSQPLDLSTVRTTNEKIPRTRKRIFGLQEAPIYYPTTEEFKDPIQYIQKIKPEAEQYGIIKIVPPKEYEPGFCLNTEIFRFRTRIQKMNSMEGATRANLNYLDKVQKFHRVLHGKPISRIPVLDKRPIDLYRLKNDVAEKGGFQKVCDEKQWAEIGRSMGYSRQQCTSMSNALKKAYMQIVMPYEHWLAKHKARRSTPLRKDTNDENSDNEPSQELCEICREEGNDDNLVVCDDCDRAYHIFCVEPPLATVPSHEWYCIDCLTGASGDYGFEDGGEYSLPEFHAFCDKFKKRWFSKEKPVKNPDVVAEEDCEDEFWRLVDNPHETCEVEYGADLHSNHHGSGFAPIERGPDGVKGDDPWNLNMIPVLPSSLFTHIKTDISGMMVPWLYIGMCFSAFCWHNEDHFTYSINYMHWGETKTWYGVPGEDTTKFEDTMKKAVPELFEQQPNLLFQLVTMLSPGRLLKEKVRVYAVDQRPGEFVVTFPKAYHSGFNHGFNFCEAVNFAPVDWLHYGLECAKRYKDHRRQPCFSHDELLVNIAKMEVPSENVKWIKAAVSDMEQRELGDRKRFKQQHPSIKQQLSVTKDSNDILFSNDLDQEHLQCLACHCYTYLSYVTCPCTKKVACFEHFDELCKCKESSKLVHLRFSEDELHSLVEMAGGKGNHPSEWLRRAKARLSDDNLTTEEALRMQLKEAKTEGVSKYYTWEMERTLASLKEWEAQASTLLDDPVKQSEPVPRSRQPKHKKYTPTYCGNQYNDLLDLRKRATAMSLRSPLTARVEARINETDEFKKQVRHLLNNDSNTTLHDLETAFNYGLNELHTDIEEMELLNLTLKQRRWLDVLEPQVMQQQPLEYEAVTALVKEAQECQLPLTNERHLSAVSKAKLGEGWLKMARRLLPAVSGKQAVTMDDLDEVLNVDHDVPTLHSVYQELDTFRSKVKSWLLLFRRTMMQSEQQQLLHRPSAEDIHNLQDQMRKLPRHMIQNQSAVLDLELKHLLDWTTTVKKILRPRHNTKKSFSDILSDMRIPIYRILNQCAPSPLPTPPEGTSNNRKQLGKRQQQQLQRKRRESAEAPGAVYCICRLPKSGFMHECSLCHELYHGNCINKNSRRQSNPSYVCPMCDPSYDFAPFAARPEFEQFCNVMEEADDLKLLPRTYPALYDILTVLTSYHDRLDAFCRSKQHMATYDDRVMARKYLKELLGLPMSFAGEMELLHKMLHSTPHTEPVAQHQHQQHEQHHQDQESCDTHDLDSGSRHNTLHNSSSPAPAPAPVPALPSTTATTVIQSPLPTPSLLTNAQPSLSNDCNAIQHNSSSLPPLAHVLPSTATMKAPAPPRCANSDIDFQHYSPDRKREFPSTVDHSNKRQRQDTPSNVHGHLPMDNLHNSS